MSNKCGNPNLRSPRIIGVKNSRKLYICIYVVAHFVDTFCVQCFKMLDVNEVKIKMNEKEIKFKSSTLINDNLAMIFRLDLNQGIYVHFLRRRGDNPPFRTLGRGTLSTENE